MARNPNKPIAFGPLMDSNTSEATDSSGNLLVAVGDELPAGTNNIGDVDISTIAMPTTLRNGVVSVPTAGTRVQLTGSATPLQSAVTIKGLPGNTGVMYIGNSGVAAANGYHLAANAEVTIVIDDLSKIWIDTSVSGNGVSYIGT